MNIRVLKTKAAIAEAFLDLRMITPLNRVRVKDICDKAGINKTTFYKHYKDVNALSEVLENKVVDALMADFPEKGCLLSDPWSFLCGMPVAFNAHRDVVVPLFKDRPDVLAQKTEAKLVELYRRPDWTTLDEVRIIYILGGISHAIERYQFESASRLTEIFEYVSKMIEALK